VESFLETGVGGRKAVLIVVQVGATKNVAWRFHNDNIRCNAVLPGGMYFNPSILPTVPNSNLAGVATNIQNSVNMDCFDKDGFGSFLYVPSPTLFRRMLLMSWNSPVVQMHVAKNEKGQPVPVITPEDVAKGIAYLASDEARMISGALLPIDAAWSTL
jgi:NAD(P)-dependent dehydrogenase (short-subunit alcohol dehydrogenase family)